MAWKVQAPELAKFGDYCTSPLTGATLWRPEVCTAEQGRQCHILKERRVWNDFLLAIQLELKEESLGKLSLVPTIPRHLNYDYYFGMNNPWTAKRIHEANTLLYLLLTEHRCVSEVRLRIRTRALKEYNGLMSFGLRASSARKSVMLLDSMFEPLSEELIPLLSSFFSTLSEIDVSMKDGLNNILRSTLATSSCLKALTLRGGRSNNLCELKELMNVLANTITLTALDIECCCFYSVRLDLTSCLGKHLSVTESLTTLTFRGGSSILLTKIVAMLHQNSTLSVVTFESFDIYYDAAFATQKYLTENLTLRSFNLSGCKWYGSVIDDLPPAYDTDKYGKMSERIHPWLLILEKNHTLEEMTFSMTGFSPAECDALLGKLRQNSSLKKVTIEDMASYLKSYVHFRGWQHQAVDTPDVIFTECKKLHDIRFPYTTLADQESVILLKSLLSCMHIKVVTFCLPPYFCDEQVVPLIARYIEEASALNELSVIFRSLDAHYQNPSGPTKILESLLRNKSIRKLRVKGCYSDWRGGAVLAKVIESSKTITEYSLAFDNATFTDLVHGLSDIEKNFTFVTFDLQVKEYDTLSEDALSKLLALKDIALRNLRLVTYAAHCVEGDLSRHCAEALERVATNPALGEKVCQLVSLDSQQAAEMIRHRLSCLQEMDNFMRAAGVVKERVLCERHDCKPQLCDLVVDCWFCIRRYLSVSDILYNA